MTIKSVVSLSIVALGLLACSLLSRATPPAPPATVEIIRRNSEPTPTPLTALSLHEAWAIAWPELEPWAKDARPTQKWTCAYISESGACRGWQGLAASAELNQVAEILMKGTQVEVRPSNVPALGKPAVEASFSREGVVDSPQAVQMGWAWLESQGLRTEQTLLRSLILRSGPGHPDCGPGPNYGLSFDAPPGQVCLDAYSGAVIHSSYR